MSGVQIKLNFKPAKSNHEIPLTASLSLWESIRIRGVLVSTKNPLLFPASEQGHCGLAVRRDPPDVAHPLLSSHLRVCQQYLGSTHLPHRLSYLILKFFLSFLIYRLSIQLPPIHAHFTELLHSIALLNTGDYFNNVVCIHLFIYCL